MAAAKSASALAYRHIFGLNGSVSHNVDFCDETTVVYVAGHSIVLYDTAEKRQRFIHGSDALEGITCMAVSPNKGFVAVAERSERALVLVYDLHSLRKRKNLRFAETQSKEIVAMAFNRKGDLLVTLTGAPDWVAVVWTWSKAKPKANRRVVEVQPALLSQVSFWPEDTNRIVVSGKDTIKFFEMEETDAGTFELEDIHHHGSDQSAAASFTGTTFLCHVWLQEQQSANAQNHLVASTEAGDLLLFEGGRYVCHLSAAPGEEMPITTMVAVSNGFIAGASKGTFLYYTFALDPQSSSDLFELAHQWSMAQCNVPLSHLCLSVTEDVLAAVTMDHQLVRMPISNVHSLNSDSVTQVSTSFHGPGAVRGLDVCVRKPVVATCSRDNTIRVWNFVTLQLEQCKSFQEEMFTLALHPSGLHVAVGFADKLRILHILMGDMRVYKEYPIKSCRECRFSHGGQYLAAVNSTAISVYNFYTGEKVADLRGHNGKIRCLYWHQMDSMLISCGHDGAMYLWSVEECKRITEFVHKGTMYTSVVSTPESLFAVGSDRLLKELEMPELNIVKELDAGCEVSHLALSASKQLMFVGAGAAGRPGFVRVYTYPLTGDYVEYPCVGASISRMQLSMNENFLIVADEAGCICCFEVRDRTERMPHAMTQIGNEWSEEVLVTRGELEDKQNAQTELRTKVDELTLHNEYQLRLKDMNFSEKVKEVTEKYVQEIEQHKTKYDLLLEEKSDLEMEFESRVRTMEERHMSQMQDIENSFQQRIMAEVERYQQLVHERDSQQQRHQEQRELLISTHDRYVKELKEEFDQKLEEDRQLRLQLEDEKGELIREFEETQQQLEDDIDTEISRLREEYEKKLTASRDATLKYKGENGIMRKKVLVLEKDIEDEKEETKVLQDQERELLDKIKILEREIAAHKREIKNRDSTIAEKEKRIYDLKKKNQELEKFKFVLDYKIKELKQQIEPREVEISTMREQIKDMDRELERYHRSNAALDEMIGTLREKLNEMMGEIQRKRTIFHDQNTTLQQFVAQLQLAVQAIQDPAALSEEVTRLIENFASGVQAKKPLDATIQSEYDRHRRYLEKSIAAMKRQLHQDTTRHQAQNAKLMEENMALIRDINTQREANVQTKQRVQARLGVLQRRSRSAGSGAPGQPKQPRRRKAAGGTGGRTGAAAATGTGGAGAGGGTLEPDVNPYQIININRQRVAAMRRVMRDLEGRLVSNRSYSREVLPPMAGGEAVAAKANGDGPQEEEEFQMGNGSGSARGAEQLPPTLAPVEPV